MILEYLSKVGKYIYNNRILMIICVLSVFVVVSNLLKFISNLHTENFDNLDDTFPQNKNPPQNNNPPTQYPGFMANQFKNMKNSNAS
jgi:hypothetical protein